MACERCSAPVASDGVRLSSVFNAPNGKKLFLAVQMQATSDARGQHAAMFCETCWLFFLETFGNRAEKKRIIGA